MIYSLYQRTTRDVRLRSTFLGKSSDDNSYHLGSHRTGEASNFHKKSKKYPHPLSMPNDKAWGSDERIVLPSGTGTEIRATDAEDGNRNGGNIGGDDGTTGKGITIVTELSVESSKNPRGSVDRKDDHKRFPTMKPSGFDFRPHL